MSRTSTETRTEVKTMHFCSECCIAVFLRETAEKGIQDFGYSIMHSQKQVCTHPQGMPRHLMGFVNLKNKGHYYFIHYLDLIYLIYFRCSWCGGNKNKKQII
jgi:hypothetical protein